MNNILDINDVPMKLANSISPTDQGLVTASMIYEYLLSNPASNSGATSGSLPTGDVVWDVDSLTIRRSGRNVLSTGGGESGHLVIGDENTESAGPTYLYGGYVYVRGDTCVELYTVGGMSFASEGNFDFNHPQSRWDFDRRINFNVEGINVTCKSNVVLAAYGDGRVAISANSQMDLYSPQLKHNNAPIGGNGGGSTPVDTLDLDVNSINLRCNGRNVMKTDEMGNLTIGDDNRDYAVQTYLYGGSLHMRGDTCVTLHTVGGMTLSSETDITIQFVQNDRWDDPTLNINVPRVLVNGGPISGSGGGGISWGPNDVVNLNVKEFNVKCGGRNVLRSSKNLIFIGNDSEQECPELIMQGSKATMNGYSGVNLYGSAITLNSPAFKVRQ